MRLIAFSGIPGSGKTTLARAVRHALAGRSRQTELVDGKPDNPDMVRRLHRLDWRDDGGRKQQDLWIADYILLNMVRLTKETVRPSLAAGKLVLLDRWLLDQVVNQRFFGNELEAFDQVDALEPPELTILLAVPVEVARERNVARRSGPLSLDLEFLSYAAAAYDELALRTPTVMTLDGTRSPADLVPAVLEVAGI